MQPINDDFRRGMEAAQATADPSEQLTTDEIQQACGPDFMAGECTDEPPAFHKGWDYAIRLARQGQPDLF